MSEPSATQDAVSNVNSSLYEIVVYFGSTSLAVILASVSLVKPSVLLGAVAWIATLGAAQQIVLLLVSATVAYVYGQLASTLSSTLIGRQIRRLSRLLPQKYTEDYLYDFTEAVERLGFKDRLPPEKINNKWTLLFFVRSKNPGIARDLSKQQMRERLARLNALNILLLLTLNLSHILIIHSGYQLPPTSILKEIVSPYWVGVFAVLLLLFSYEFYKRACWNNDLIVKVLPVVE